MSSAYLAMSVLSSGAFTPPTDGRPGKSTTSLDFFRPGPGADRGSGPGAGRVRSVRPRCFTVPVTADGWAPATFLGSLPGPVAGELVARCVRKRFDGGRVLIREGDAGTHVVLLLGGFVKAVT